MSLVFCIISILQEFPYFASAISLDFAGFFRFFPLLFTHACPATGFLTQKIPTCEQEEIADKLLPVVGNNLRTLPVYGIINAKICHCSLFRIRVHLQSRRRQVVRLLTQKGI